MQFNKLVRDKILDIIRENGDTPQAHTATDEEFKEKLFEKLREESEEYLREPSPEELADILEVVFALSENVHSTSREELEIVRKEKEVKRGAFTKRIILEETN